MTAPDPTASMSPEELIAVIERGLTADEERARRAGVQWDDEDVRYEWEDLPDDVFAHARCHDPSRVLADVQAKREILEWCKTEEYEATTSGDLDMGYEQGYRDASAGYLRILRALARPYLDQETL